MRTQRRKGKKLDTWTFRVDRKETKVEVRMETDHAHGRVVNSFVAYHDAEPIFRMEENDINLLRSKVHETLKKAFSVVWKNMLLVEVTGIVPRTCPTTRMPGTEEKFWKETHVIPWDGWEAQADLHIQVKAVRLGTNADGKECHQTHRNTTYDGGFNLGAHDARQFGEERGKNMRALIPDSLATRKALNEIFSALMELQKRLSQYLSPEQIQQTINTVIAGRMLLLPAPEKKLKEKKE